MLLHQMRVLVYEYEYECIIEQRYLNEHPELQEEAKSLCGQEIVIKKELYPEYTIFVYDAVITVAKGIESVLAINPNATFLYELN